MSATPLLRQSRFDVTNDPPRFVSAKFDKRVPMHLELRFNEAVNSTSPNSISDGCACTMPATPPAWK